VTGVNPGESGPDFVPSKAAVDPYAEPPDPLLSSILPGGDVWDRISSALEHRSAGEPARPEPSLLQNALTEPSQRSTTGELSHIRALATLGSWKGRQNHLSVEGQSGKPSTTVWNGKGSRAKDA